MEEVQRIVQRWGTRISWPIYCLIAHSLLGPVGEETKQEWMAQVGQLISGEIQGHWA